MGMSVYFLTSRILERQVKDSIELEIQELAAEYAEDGMPTLKREIADKEKIVTDRVQEYGVIDNNGHLVAGDIGNLKPLEGWQKVPIPFEKRKFDRENDDYLNVKVVMLTEQRWLGVGYTANYIEDALDAIVSAFSWGLLLVLMLGGAGGLYVTRSFLKKIEAITNSTHAIIAGDIRHRLSVSKTRDELDDLAILLNRMLDKICKLIENVQQVSNDIAHDLRTPISHLKFRLEDALHKNLTPEQYKNNIGGMVHEVDTILNTFSALLRIAQIESGSRRSGFTSVNLSERILAVAEALEPVAEEKSKRLICSVDSNIFLSGDKELLTQLAYNLIENALVHTQEHAQINVELKKTEQKVQFIVFDNGLGIPQEQQEKIFQRFYRVEGGRTTPGNGLGLSIVSAIADLHSARIKLSDNKPGLKIAVQFK